MQFLMVGDDRRQQCLAQLLQKKHAVLRFGDPACPSQADCIMLPCPSFDSTGRLRAPYTLDALEPYLTPQTTVFCCGAAHPLKDSPAHCVNLLADETAVLQNARLTAEATLLAVMEREEDSLQRKRCLIVGYGRIGTYLTRLLSLLGADCTVFARRAYSRALVEGFGVRTAAPGRAQLEGFDFVFNTVPAQALSRTELAMLPETAVWVELASAPGGLPQGGMPFAFSVLPAGGLPGRYLPFAAARVLYDAIERHLSSRVDAEC